MARSRLCQLAFLACFVFDCNGELVAIVSWGQLPVDLLRQPGNCPRAGASPCAGDSRKSGCIAPCALFLMMLSACSQEMTAAQKKKAKKKAKDKAKKAADAGDGEEAAPAPSKKGAKKVRPA